MSRLNCAFKKTLVAGELGCSQAVPVTVRDGPSMACTDADASARCASLLAALEAAALPAFDAGEDLAQLPHSTLLKIQMGGLLGLQGLLADTPSPRVEDIGALVKAAREHFGAAGIPVSALVPGITAYRLKRRR